MMMTGTTNQNDVGNITQSFVNDGHTQIEIKKDDYGQWIIVAKG